MAVVIVNEMTGRDGSVDDDTNKRYRRTFRVRTSAPDDGAYVVLKDPRIPALNSTYSYLDTSGQPFTKDDGTPGNTGDPFTVTDGVVAVVNRRATQDNPNDPLDWLVVVDYAGVDSPFTQPAEVDYSPVRYQKSIVVDVNGKPIQNSAGDPFAGGITVDRTRYTLTITKAVPTWDPGAMAAYQDTVNKFTFQPDSTQLGLPAGTCKLVMAAKRVRRVGSDTFFWVRTATIEIDLNGWRVKVRDAGLNHLLYSAAPTPGGPLPFPAAKTQIMVSPGILATTPELLNPDGTWVGKLRPGDPVPAPLEFDGYVERDWTDLDPELEY